MISLKRVIIKRIWARFTTWRFSSVLEYSVRSLLLIVLVSWVIFEVFSTSSFISIAPPYWVICVFILYMIGATFTPSFTESSKV